MDIKTKQIFSKLAYKILFVIMAVIFVTVVMSYVNRERIKCNYPVDTESLKVLIDKQELELNIKCTPYKVINDVQYYEVTFFSRDEPLFAKSLEPLILTEQEKNTRIRKNTAVRTSVYTFTAYSEENYPFKVLFPDTVKVARYSFMGESDFTEEELESLKEESAEILTNQKYKVLGFKKSYQPPEGFLIVK